MKITKDIHSYFPNGRADFAGLEKDFPFFKEMADCAQDKRYHAEGSVWDHTKSCLHSLYEIDEFDDLSDREKLILNLATLFHDVGKPETTRDVENEITSKNHSVVGSSITRISLWDTEDSWIMAPWDIREAVANLVMLHMLPIHFMDKKDPLYSVCSSSYLVSNKLLYILGMADNMGRICANAHENEISMDTVRLFKSYCEENECYDVPVRFLSDEARFRYFFEHNGHPKFDRYEETTANVIIMSGIQGVGKSYTIKKEYSGMEMTGLDETRAQLGLKPCENEGFVYMTAKENCRKLMRVKKDFVFNAINTTKDARYKLIRLFRDYGYKIIIHYIEKPLQVALKNNKSRKAVVPESIILKKFEGLEVPTLVECHDLITTIKEKNERN